MERHHLTNCWRHWERGELNIKNSIPNPTPKCTSCAPMSDSCIGKVFGFNVTLLFGCWMRRETAGTGRPKILNHWAMYLKLRRGKIGMWSLIFTSLFDCIGQATSPRHQIRVVLKIPNPTLRHHLSNCWRHWERRELNIKNSIPNPTPECTSCAPTSNSHIGEVFGFEVTLLFGCWTRRERTGTGRPKFLNHWAVYLKLWRDEIGTQSLIFTLLFDCIGQATSPRDQIRVVHLRLIHIPVRHLASKLLRALPLEAGVPSFSLCCTGILIWRSWFWIITSLPMRESMLFQMRLVLTAGLQNWPWLTKGAILVLLPQDWWLSQVFCAIPIQHWTNCVWVAIPSMTK